MANYFTNFSLVLPLRSEAEQAYAIELARYARQAQMGDDRPADFPADLTEAVEDWFFETDPENSPGKWGLWLHTDSGGVDAVCAFVQHLLQKFDPEGSVKFEWSHDCGQPRVDAYGGGAAVITARKVLTITTSDWLKSVEV